MGVGKDTFGGFLMAQRELQAAGVNPFKHFERLEFSGLPQDAIVYAVRDGRVDAGTVRTDLLEGMAAEGRIDLAEFKAIGARSHPDFPSSPARVCIRSGRLRASGTYPTPWRSRSRSRC